MARPKGSRNKTVRVPKVKRTCLNCGVEFERYASCIKRPDQGRYCSNACKFSSGRPTALRGDKHPNWKGGGSTYRSRALRHYGAFCADCGYDEYVTLLDVHHRDFAHVDHALANLIVLCVRCHMERHIKAGQLLAGMRGSRELRVLTGESELPPSLRPKYLRDAQVI